MGSRLRYGLTVAVLAGAYYGLATLLFEKMPYASIPAWWLAAWPSRHAGLLAWFQTLNVIGALVAALPIALLVTWGVGRHKLWTALAIAAATTVVVFVQAPASGSLPSAHPASAASLWLNDLVLAGSLLFAVPLLVRLLAILPSNNRWRVP